jgi:AcrR family transcriptional regulator
MKDTGLGSRERMIEATIALMRRSGLSGAGINEIVRESGAPKGSVYHFFPGGKLQIATEAIAIYAHEVLEVIDLALASKRLPSDKVKALFNAFARRVEEDDFRQSCAVGAVSLDLETDLEELRVVLAAAFSEWVALIARHFDFPDASRTKSFAGLVLTTIEGAYIRCRAERSSRPFKEAGVWLAELAERHA